MHLSLNPKPKTQPHRICLVVSVICCDGVFLFAILQEFFVINFFISFVI